MRIDERRLSVATNAAAGAMYGAVRAVNADAISENELAGARMVALRVLEHIDAYDNRESAAAKAGRPLTPKADDE